MTVGTLVSAPPSRPPIELDGTLQAPLLSLYDIVRVACRRKWPALTVLAIAVLGAVLYAAFTPPTYVASSRILVRIGREKLSPLTVTNVPTANFVFSERPENINDEIEILRSPAVLDRAYPALRDRLAQMSHAVENPPAADGVGATFAASLRGAKRTAASWARAVIEAAKQPAYALGLARRVPPEVSLREVLASSLLVTSIKETNVIVLGFAWHDPDFASFALNAIAEAYKQERLRVHANLSGAVEFYRSQKARMDAELTELDHGIDAQAASSGVSDPLAEKQLSLTLIGALEHEQADAQLTEQQTRARIADLQRAVQGGAEWPDTPGIANVNLPGLADLDSRYGALTGTRNGLLTQFKPGAREIRDLDQQIAQLRQQKLRSLLGYYQDRVQSAQQTQEAAAQRLREARGRMERMGAVATQYMTLQDRREQLLTQLKAYRKQIEDLTLQQSLNEGDFASVTMLGPATPPSLPAGPRNSLIIGLAAAFGLILGLAMIVLGEFFDRTVSNERDVERVLGLPVVARIPQSAR